ncbi:acyltransferase [Salmonella bongori serovar 40:z35:-]|uniref:acyltransferase family protein n=1 Tax=Salmonella bongori TaxID=54736 RepID=UPI0018529AE9|nr:acyltransferase [Salmonella bongori]EGE4655853.1 acyltransferase [Salmonella bongori serovar 40:z35:- str. 95-0123]QVP38373.1 acyltransferase [Salmonella bongori serovar 40:z35:-]
MNWDKNKILSIEGIRGVACVMVVMSHFSLTFFPSMHMGSAVASRGWFDMAIYNSPFAFLYSGSAAVGIFFVLSGFILSHVINSKDNIPKSAVELLIKRPFRLGIPSIASCLIAYLVFHFSFENSMLGTWFYTYKVQNPSFLGAIYNGSVLPFLWGDSTYNWSLWTMKIELFGSLITAILCITLTYSKYKKVIIILFALTPYFLGIKQNDDIYYSSFMLGCLVYYSKFNINNIIAFPVMILGIYLCGYHSDSTSYSWVQNNVFLSVYGRTIDNYVLMNNIGGFLFVTCIIKNKLLSGVFSLKFLQHIGKLSFSTYLIHMPVMFIMCPSIFNKFYSLGFPYWQASTISILSTLITVYLLSIPFYIYIDSFGMKVSNFVKRKVIVLENAPPK